MLKCKGVLVGSKFIDSIINCREVKIHSIFSRVINLECKSIGLLSVVMGDVGMASNYLQIERLENLDFTLLDIREGDSAYMRSKKLILNEGIDIDFQVATTWKGNMELVYEGNKINENDGVIKKNIGQGAYKIANLQLRKENLRTLEYGLKVYSAENSMYRRIFQQEEALLKQSVDSLKLCGSRKDINGAVEGLIGFGPGLTPSGDDFLAGLGVVTYYCSFKTEFKQYLEEAVAKGMHRTNTISAAMLKNSLKGEAHEFVQDLMYAVMFQNPPEVIEKLKKLIKVGATSGSDLATGVYVGFVIFN